MKLDKYTVKAARSAAYSAAYSAALQTIIEYGLSLLKETP